MSCVYCNCVSSRCKVSNVFKNVVLAGNRMQQHPCDLTACQIFNRLTDVHEESPTEGMLQVRKLYGSNELGGTICVKDITTSLQFPHTKMLCVMLLLASPIKLSHLISHTNHSLCKIICLNSCYVWKYHASQLQICWSPCCICAQFLQSAQANKLCTTYTAHVRSKCYSVLNNINLSLNFSGTTDSDSKHSSLSVCWPWPFLNCF